MIFLTIGTHEPFQRLVNAFDAWVAQAKPDLEIFGQITDQGIADCTPKNFPAVGRITPTEYAEKFAQAKLIVSHAGMGSIITALSQGKPIVVMPRRGHLRETRNDHQYTTVKKLGSRDGIFVAEDEASLPKTMDIALASITKSDRQLLSPFAEERMTNALRKFIIEA